MNPYESYLIKGKIILTISIVLAIVSVCFFYSSNFDFNKEDYNFIIENIDIKDMSKAKSAVKKSKKDSIFSSIVSSLSPETSKFKQVALENVKKEDSETQLENKQVWYLPTEQGYITQYAHYGHIALDITSARGTNERIYPVADGIISGIFYDDAGAKIVTVNHNVAGQSYTSQYVHLSWYDPSIYVGKPVTTSDPLGGMGATGIATGIHLHITVLDCSLFDPNDANCSTLNGFYNYGIIRQTQGFYGLGNLMEVPYRWYSR